MCEHLEFRFPRLLLTNEADSGNALTLMKKGDILSINYQVLGSDGVCGQMGKDRRRLVADPYRTFLPFIPSSWFVPAGHALNPPDYPEFLEMRPMDRYQLCRTIAYELQSRLRIGCDIAWPRLGESSSLAIGDPHRWPVVVMPFDNRFCLPITGPEEPEKSNNEENHD